MLHKFITKKLRESIERLVNSEIQRELNSQQQKTKELDIQKQQEIQRAENLLQNQITTLQQEIQRVENLLQNQITTLQQEIQRVENLLQNQITALQQEATASRHHMEYLLASQTGFQIEYLLAQRSILTQQIIKHINQQTDPVFNDSVTLSNSSTQEVKNLVDYFKMLEDLAPKAYSHWYRLLEPNAKSYEGFPIDSCSVKGHPEAEIFKHFLVPYLVGRVLDIGCGPQPVPSYLDGYPPHSISGIDPLAPAEPHPFEFYQGVAEFLPWNDRVFDVVIAATSLDHVLLLEKVFSEVCRVLKDNGYFIVWVGFVQGATKYNPYCSDIQPVDSYHLFHFDRGWFGDLIENYFEIEEEIKLNSSSHFFSLKPKIIQNFT
jgi:SAM-dependent methyltransferase